MSVLFHSYLCGRNAAEWLIKMTKRDLAQAAGFSQYMMGKFTKDEYVSLKEIATLCGIFHCDIGDVVEVIED